MKKNLLLTMSFVLMLVLPVRAEILKDVYEEYLEMSEPDPDTALKLLFEEYSKLADEQMQSVQGFPGRIIGDLPAEYKAYFSQKWKMRSVSYELYFADSRQLAESVFELAIFANDVDADFPKDRFLRGVLGFHYSSNQVLDFANSLYKKGLLANDYPYLIRLLLEDKVLLLTAEGFKFSDDIRHVLAASAGKKRTFASTLEHERLHVFWDEDDELREKQIKKWNALSDEQKSKIKKELHQYAKNNEAQFIEEWSVHSTEKSNFSLY